MTLGHIEKHGHVRTHSNLESKWPLTDEATLSMVYNMHWFSYIFPFQFESIFNAFLLDDIPLFACFFH